MGDNAGDNSRCLKSSTAGLSGAIATESIFADNWYLEEIGRSQIGRFCLRRNQQIPSTQYDDQGVSHIVTPSIGFRSQSCSQVCAGSPPIGRAPKWPKSVCSRTVVYLPVMSGYLVAVYPTETEKRWRLREEQDRPIIFRRCAQLRVGSWESKQWAAQGDGQTRTVYKVAQQSQLKQAGVTRVLLTGVGRAEVGWSQVWSYSDTLYIQQALSSGSSHVQPLLSFPGSLFPGLLRSRYGPTGEGEDASRWQRRVGQRHRTQRLRTAATGPDQRGMELVPLSRAPQEVYIEVMRGSDGVLC